MAERDEEGSITSKQKRFLAQLLQERDEFDADWFDELKANETQIDSLSRARASEFIDALMDKRPPRTSHDAERDEASDGNEPSEARPLSEKQASYLQSLLEKAQLVEDGMIDVDSLMLRLNSRAASYLIDALRNLDA